MAEELDTLLYRFGVALAIGVLIGIERESRTTRDSRDPEDRSDIETAPGEPPKPKPQESAAGIRTFSLYAVSGAIAGYLSTLTSPWLLVAALIAMASLVLGSYVTTAWKGKIGMTSEVSGIIVFLLGALCSYGETTLAGAVAVAVAALLSLKEGLHGLAGRIKREDIHATLKFLVLTAIILPILPDEPLPVGRYFLHEESVASSPETPAIETETEEGTATPNAEDGPEAEEEPWWASLTVHPRKIWYMVVLISAISFCGYILGQLLGTHRGLTVTALVGGLVSSTAVSLSYSQRSVDRSDLSPQFGIGILLANAIMPIRLLLVVGIIAPVLLKYLSLPLLLMVAAAGISALVLHRRHARTARDHDTSVGLQNPFEIGPALKFGLLFGVVLFAAQVAQALFSDAGLYVVAIMTGLTDVDAIGLAVANLVADGKQVAVIGAITITLAVISNTVVKAYFVATMGSERLRRIALLAFGLMFVAAAGGIVALWFMGRT